MVGKAKNSYEQSCNLRKSLSHLNFVLVTLRIWDFMEDMKFISGVKGLDPCLKEEFVIC